MQRSSCLFFSFLFWLLAQNLIGKYLLVNLQEELGQDKDTNAVKKTPSRGWKTGLDLVDPNLDQGGSANEGWTEWYPWSECSSNCGGGEQISKRDCSKSSSPNGGKPCEGERIRKKYCDLGPCPVDCTWAEWSPWYDFECLQLLKHFTCLKKHQRDRTMRKIRVVLEMEMYGGRPCKTNNGTIITDHDYKDIVEKPCHTPRCPKAAAKLYF